MHREDERWNQSILRYLGQAIRNHRLTMSLSQQELGKKSSLHRTYITDIENGRRNLSFLTLSRVAVSLEIPLSRLISDVERLQLEDQLSRDSDKTSDKESCSKG